jgi:hypothetical protein
MAMVLGVGRARAAPSPAPTAGGSPLAIVPFTGLHAEEPQSVVVRMLKKRAQLMPAADVGKTTAQVIISGSVEKSADSKLTLVVSALSSKSGDVVGQLSFPVPKTRHLTREQLHDLATQVNTLADQAMAKVTGEMVAAEAPPSEDEANAAVEAAVAQSGDTEAVPMDINDLSQAQLRGRMRRAMAARPRWAPLLDASVGVVIAGRSLSVNPAPAPSYKPGSGAGIHADATIYPLAFFHDVAKGAIAGLGAGLTLDAPFWPTTQAQADNPGAPGEYGTHEFRIEGGARWKFTLHKSIPRFELSALLGGGLHSFSIGRLVNAQGQHTDVGPPNVGYVFGAFGLLGRLHFREWGSVWAAFSYEYVPDAGHVEDAEEYGYANVWGLNLRGGVDIFVWRGLKAGVSAYWERFALEFTHQSPYPFKVANNAVDQFYGGIITIGYVL